MDFEKLNLPSVVDRVAAAEAVRQHTAAVQAQGFHHAVADATLGDTVLSRPTNGKAIDSAPPSILAPIVNTDVNGSLQPVAIVETDLGDIASGVTSRLAEANDKLERIDAEASRLKARRDELAKELEAEQQHAAAASIAGARALLEGDQPQRAKRAERRSRAEAAIRELTTAIKIADQRIEALRVDRISADEQRALWAGAAADLAVLQAAPSLAEKLNELLGNLNPLEGSRRTLMSQFVGGAMTGKGSSELRRYLDGLARRLDKLVSPPKSVAKAYASADTVISCNRAVEYEKDANSTHAIPAGATALVPAHVAQRIVALGGGELPSQPAKVEIKALCDLHQVGEGSVPRGYTLWVTRAVADALCAARKAERTGFIEFAPGSEPVSKNSRMPLLALGYVAPPTAERAGMKEAAE